MEKTGLRRFDFALLQDQQTGSGRATIEAELRFHFHSHHDRVGDEDILARERADRGATLILPRSAHRKHSFLAGCLRFCWHSRQRDCNHDLCQPEVLRRNF